MKKAAFGIACGLVAFFVFAMLLTVYGRSIRKGETDTALSQAIDATLSGVMSENNYTIEENETFVADFLKALLIQTNSDSDRKVSILEADYELGILSVEITEKFKHPNGREGTVSEVRTVIFDKVKEEDAVYKTVRFYAADQIYKEYTLVKDSLCSVPVSPKKEGKVFRCWRFVTGGVGEAESVSVTSAKGTKQVLASEHVPYAVSENTNLIAVFE